MKNLINRVLVVLTVSALFAGSIDASQQKRGRRAPTTKKMPAKPANRMTTKKMASAISREKRALSYLRHRSRGNFKVYTAELRKADAAVLRDAVPSAKDQIAILERESINKDDAKRATSFTTGAGMKAAAAVEAAMLNTDLKDAVADLKENPSADNVAKVAALQTEATVAVSQLDDQVEGYKGYMTARNILMGTIAVAGVGLATAYVVYGITPTVAATSTANAIYNATSAAGEALGFQEGGRVHGFAKKYVAPTASWAYGQVEGATNAAINKAAGSWLGQKFGYMTAEQKLAAEQKLEQQIEQQDELAVQAYMAAQQDEEKLQAMQQQ